MDRFSSSKNPFRPPPPPLSWPLFSCAFTDKLMECVYGSVERVPPAVLPSSEDSFMAFLLMGFEEYVRVRVSSNLAKPVEHDTSMLDEMDELLIEIDKFRLGNSEEDDKFRMGNSEGYDFTRNYKKDGSLSNNHSRKLQKLMEFNSGMKLLNLHHLSTFSEDLEYVAVRESWTKST